MPTKKKASRDTRTKPSEPSGGFAAHVTAAGARHAAWIIGVLGIFAAAVGGLIGREYLYLQSDPPTSGPSTHAAQTATLQASSAGALATSTQSATPTPTGGSLRIAFLDRNGTVYVSNSLDQFLSNHDAYPVKAKVHAWSPDGTQMAFLTIAADQQFYVLIPGGTATPFITAPYTPSNIAWAPDGGRVALILNQNGFAISRLAFFDVSRGGYNVLSLSPDAIIDPDWSPNGEQIAYSAWVESGDQQLRVYHVDSDRRAILVDNGNFSDTSPSWARRVWVRVMQWECTLTNTIQVACNRWIQVSELAL